MTVVLSVDALALFKELMLLGLSGSIRELTVLRAFVALGIMGGSVSGCWQTEMMLSHVEDCHLHGNFYQGQRNFHASGVLAIT